MFSPDFGNQISGPRHPDCFNCLMFFFRPKLDDLGIGDMIKTLENPL
jgi:hypothetical protein